MIGKVKNNGGFAGISDDPEDRQLYHAYEKRKKEAGRIDFDDMLLLCYQLFCSRPDILKKWQDKFRYILVDEFQDVNQAQYDVVRMLAEPQNNLFVVGDGDIQYSDFKYDVPAGKYLLSVKGFLRKEKKGFPNPNSGFLFSLVKVDEFSGFKNPREDIYNFNVTNM
jgi:hypothetical protein